MTDFFQNGVIATLHNLTDRKTDSIEAELKEWSSSRPMSLILPCLYSELERPAINNIVEQLKDAEYISEIIIGLDAANKNEFEHASFKST